jgi:lipopolysaccharide assembly outer membrane protein LptD (OstA)
VKLSQSLRILSLIICGIASGSIVLPVMVDGQENRQGNTPVNDSRPPAPDSTASGKDDLDTTVVYTARDSLIYDLDRRTMDLYGKAKVNYQDMQIQGPKISVDYKTSIVDTNAETDSLGHAVELPVFTDKNGTFTAETMKYNFETRQGRTSKVSSKFDEGFYTGGEVRRLGSGELYIREGNFTTCDLYEPHYWFAGQNMKIIPKDKLIARPCIMYIRPEIFSVRLPKIPLIPLPFMSVPINNERSSGFLIPRIGHDSVRGYYFSNLGYFWALSDYMDLRLESDFAFNGSWRVGERFRYSSRYLFSGSIEGEYERYLVNHPDDPDYVEYNNWYARIVHHHDFDPTTRLDLNLMYQGGKRYYDVNSVNPETIINEQATSYASFYKSYDEGQRVLTASYQRTEDLRNDNITQTANASIYQSKLYPFRPRKGADSRDWSSRFSLLPAASVNGQFTKTDDIETDNYTGNASVDLGYQQDFAKGYKATFTQGISLQGRYKTVDLEEDRWGTRLQLPLRIQSTLFNYLNLNPTLTFSHYRVNSSISRYYDSGEGELVTLTNDGPVDFSTYIMSVDAQTRLYGTLYTGLLENLVGLKAIRHTLIPNISFVYNPDYTGTDYDYYSTYLNSSGFPVRYNRFEQSLYSSVPSGQSALGISIQNLFHGKFGRAGGKVEAGGVEGANDKVVQMLSLTASTSYNFAADSLRMNPLTISASSNALSPNFLLSAGATYDFYSYNPLTGRRIDRLWMDDGGSALRFLRGYVNMSLSLEGTLRKRKEEDLDHDHSGNEGNTLVKKEKTEVEQAIFKERFSKAENTDFGYSLPWKLRMSLYLNSDKSNPLNPSTTALLNTYARVSLSKNWQVGFNTGYDLQENEFIFPAIQVYRDLHCWEMSFQWVPSGEYQSYFLQVGLKAPQFEDLKFRASGSM